MAWPWAISSIEEPVKVLVRFQGRTTPIYVYAQGFYAKGSQVSGLP